MSVTTAIRAELPDFPTEVVEAWLAPYGDAWRDALAERPLDAWRNLSWRQERLPLTWESLALPARRRLHTLLSVHVHGETGMAVADDGRARIADGLRHLAETGTLPGTPVLLATEDGFDVADGLHRIAALLTHRRFYAARAQYPVQTEGWATLADDFPVWVGG